MRGSSHGLFINMKKFITDSINETIKTLQALSVDDLQNHVISCAINSCVDVLNKGGKILLAGNGGSAADSQHIAAEFVSKFNFDRPGLAAIALTTDSSILTAIGNDYGYENCFSRQIEAIGNDGDVFIAYSTSGKSRNILKALEVAKAKNITTIGFTGNKMAGMEDLCDILIKAPSSKTSLIQECHAVIGHLICAQVEKAIFGDK